MRVQFEATLDDMVDVCNRSLARSRVVRGWRWEGCLIVALLTGIGSFLALSMLDGLIEEPFELKLALSGLGAVLGAGMHPLVYNRTLTHRLRKYCREQIGPDAPFTVEVQLLPEGIRVKQLNVEMTFEWPTVEDIQEREDCVDIVTRRSGILAIRSRAFDCCAARAEFVELGRRYLNESRAGSTR